MGYVKYISAAIVVALSLGSISCTTTQVQEPVASATEREVSAVLMPTLAFIPSPKVDKKGNAVPYKAVANPYLKARGSIKKSTVVQFIEARRAYRADNIDVAEKILTELLEHEKKLSGPWVMLGDIALQRNDLTLAHTQFKRALRVNRFNVNAHLRLAKVQRMQGQFITAQNTYANALSIWKDFPEGHLNLAILYDVYLNDAQKAQQHMEAYQFLTGGSNTEATLWLEELQQRTGTDVQLPIQQATAAPKPVS